MSIPADEVSSLIQEVASGAQLELGAAFADLGVAAPVRAPAAAAPGAIRHPCAMSLFAAHADDKPAYNTLAAFLSSSLPWFVCVCVFASPRVATATNAENTCVHANYLTSN